MKGSHQGNSSCTQDAPGQKPGQQHTGANMVSVFYPRHSWWLHLILSLAALLQNLTWLANWHKGKREGKRWNRSPGQAKISKEIHFHTTKYNPSQNVSESLHRNRNANTKTNTLKFTWKHTDHGKFIAHRESVAGGIATPDCKICYRAIVMKNSIKNWHKSRYVEEQNRTEVLYLYVNI